jgi:pimeloyl-ACP methyl ester carboxylesterase
MSNPSIETFTADLPHGISLSCRAAGPRGAPALVFLHGFPEGAFIWDALLAHFGTRYRCVAPNLRGYERSSAPADVESYRAKFLVQDIAALIEQTGSPLEALVGHDWGGAPAWIVGIQLPQLIRRLVVINSPHPATFARELRSNEQQQRASAYMNFLCRPDAQQLLAADDYARMWPFFEHMGGRAWLTPELRDQYRALWAMGLEGPLNYYRASPLRPPTASDPGAAGVSFKPEQVTVRVPTTVIWGEADVALPPSLLDGLEQWVPQMHLVRVPQASHWIVHEQPMLVAREIEAALRR